MSLVVLYLVSAVVFLVVDAIGLTVLLKPLFERNLGDMLLDDVKLAPAAVFYLFYVAALTWLVTWPMLNDAPLWRIALNAAIFGAAAYGTYEFTNLATLRNWTWQMVATDVTWGTLLTAGSATAGVLAARAIG
ncbi:DUF2177 family protein [Anianabacter salinae]|uniref:DUF2177 family protein n=1 Tax=Anianabacter salinae TaxID=2851023 RepID=UPI00225E2E0B|nr:DUF2177 family protein [Anianabacter salinae]MBV0912129.1 DUF2177 family protein [Anianabacter salinae]